MMYNGNHMGSWGYAFMGLGSLLFLTVLGLAAFAVFRALNRTAGGPALHPERVLADRYARGEIDDEEYRRRLGTLRGGSVR